MDELLALCLRHKVGLVVPTIDTELLSLAEQRDRFAVEGVDLVISDESLVRVCRDKRLTAQLFNSVGIDVPKILDRQQLSFPCFAKPYDGSRSVGAAKLSQAADLSDGMRDDPKMMFMEFIDQSFEEYTVDAYYDRKGVLTCLVPRHRLEVRDGEINKGVTRKHHVYEYGAEWAAEYLNAPSCDWTPEEIDFVDWVFNSAAVLKERAKLAEQHEGLTYERDPERRGAYAEKSAYFVSGITDTLSKKLVRKVRNRYNQDIWPWDRAGLDRRS